MNRESMTYPYSDSQDNQKVNHNNSNISSTDGVVFIEAVFCRPANVGESKIISRHFAEWGGQRSEVLLVESLLCSWNTCTETYEPLVGVCGCERECGSGKYGAVRGGEKQSVSLSNYQMLPFCWKYIWMFK